MNMMCIVYVYQNGLRLKIFYTHRQTGLYIRLIHDIRFILFLSFVLTPLSLSRAPFSVPLSNVAFKTAHGHQST